MSRSTSGLVHQLYCQYRSRYLDFLPSDSSSTQTGDPCRAKEGSHGCLRNWGSVSTVITRSNRTLTTISVCIISIIRLQSLVAISNSKDPTFDNTRAAILSAVETNVAIITACLPFFRPLLSRMMPKQFPSQALQYANIDEEQPRYKASITTEILSPTCACGSRTHFRDCSVYTMPESEILSYDDQQASIASIGSRAGGKVRQVTINSGRNTTLFAPRLPRLPENMAAFGPIVLGGETIPPRPSHSSHSMRSHSFHWSGHRLSKRISAIQFPRRPWSPRSPVAQKPLPITPFPLSPDWSMGFPR